MYCLRLKREMCLQENCWTAGSTKFVQKVPLSEIALKLDLREHSD